jgi:hypothetical protein
MPCDDIISDIHRKYKELDINPNLITIGYRESQWDNRADMKTGTFDEFKALIRINDTISIDNIVFIKYDDIFLWHKGNRIDRMNGSGNTISSQTWNKIKHRYAKHIQTDNCEEKKDENTKTKTRFRT